MLIEEATLARDATLSEANVGRLRVTDFDFQGAKTGYLTHGLHPYPAKYIPQIPATLIRELSEPGDTVADIFCGSGTTLVEALLLGRNAVGFDANPLACLISEAKTGRVSSADLRSLSSLSLRAKAQGRSLAARTSFSLENGDFRSHSWRPDEESLTFWFEQQVIEELAELREWCLAVESAEARALALVAFSSIIVAVSKQDSDTRYVRRDKHLSPGDTMLRFAKSLHAACSAASDFSEQIRHDVRRHIVCANLLNSPPSPALDLMVCSPPYPNAYSYHLYHRTRMLWLNMNQPLFKKDEIGSHRKYSSKAKDGATSETFRSEFRTILMWLGLSLKQGGYACFVIGDSTIRGERISNTDLIADVGRQCGFTESVRLSRLLCSTKKSFNPVIGTIRQEHILVLKNESRR